MTHLHARHTARAALLAAAAVLAAACSSSAPHASDASAAGHGFTLTVGFISPTAKPGGPEGFAYASGSLLRGLRGAGVSAVKWTAFPNGPNLSAAIAGGSVDVAIMGDTPAVTAKADGIDTRLLNDSFVGLDTWIYAAKNGPTTIAQLKGKTVATQIGSYMYRDLVTILKQAGIYSTVKITNVYTPDAVAALQSGGIAAYAAPAGQLTAVLSQAGYPVLDKASADHRALLGTEVTVATAAVLAAHPRLAADWNTVRAATIRDIQAHPAQYYAFYAAADSTPEPAIKAAYPMSGLSANPFPPAGLALLRGVNQFLVSDKLTRSAVSISSWKIGS